MKICKDGRIYGQNNKEAGSHLGILTGHQYKYNPNGLISVPCPDCNKPMSGNGERCASCAKKGERNPAYGRRDNFLTGKKRLSLAYRLKLSQVRKGEKNPMWQGGLTPINKTIRYSIEMRLWREAVFARDNYTCQNPKCRKRGGELSPHHIKSFSEYPELRFAIDNGITFCRSCHKLTPNFGGAVKKGRVYKQ